MHPLLVKAASVLIGKGVLNSGGLLSEVPLPVCEIENHQDMGVFQPRSTNKSDIVREQHHNTPPGKLWQIL